VNNSTVWFNDGTGLFMDSGQQLTYLAHGVALDDLDADGDIDIFIVCAGFGDQDGEHTHASTVYFNDGKGHFEDTSLALTDTLAGGYAPMLADLDGDGDLDAAVRYYQVPDKIFWNNGSGLWRLE